MNFYSNGKLLISGEYLVMQGAVALALPVKFGQSLSVQPNSENHLSWQTYVNDNLWFSADFDNNLDAFNVSDEATAGFLSKLLKSAKELNPQFLNDMNSSVKSNINFDIQWGLGSSSSLINNVAQWAKINPFDLFFKVANGSAYDLACAKSNRPIIYQLQNGVPNFYQVDFFPDFHHNIYFAYLGKKQKSEESIKKFKNDALYTQKDIDLVSQISMNMLHAKKFDDFVRLVNEHEQIISRILKQKTVQEQLFPDFQGAVKSLGAWGGDFIMILSNLEFDKIKKYFSEKKINTIFTFAELLHD